MSKEKWMKVRELIEKSLLHFGLFIQNCGPGCEVPEARDVKLALNGCLAVFRSDRLQARNFLEMASYHAGVSIGGAYDLEYTSEVITEAEFIKVMTELYIILG
jgi:hypothetical protein